MKKNYTYVVDIIEKDDLSNEEINKIIKKSVRKINKIENKNIKDEKEEPEKYAYIIEEWGQTEEPHENYIKYLKIKYNIDTEKIGEYNDTVEYKFSGKLKDLQKAHDDEGYFYSIDGNNNHFREFYKKDNKMKDIPPYYAPEEDINITYTEKIKNGKSPLTSGMIETAYQNRHLDNGKTFNAYIDVILDNLKEDIKNASYLVSGELTSTRKALLEDYIKIEKIVKKAGLTDKYNEMHDLIDELSAKLDLDTWKQPKFNEKMRKKESNVLRNLHRYDSKISKKFEPVFLCTPTELKNSYIDAKNGKLPEVFEANLEKVRKDMTADYDRINQGRDTYLEDPRINSILPKIVEHYENAFKFAKDLNYNEIADEFEVMLETIKKGWGL